MSKKKAANNKKGKNAADDDDEWDQILEAELKTKAAIEPPPPPAPAAQVENEAEDDDDGDDSGEEDGAAGAKKDKRKKKKKVKKDDKAKEKAGGTSATAKAILAHKQRLAEEEARIKKLQEEEEERIRQEEARIEAERRAIEEEKERKRKAKADKVAAQKAAGTYMTKAEKERAKKAQARLESLKAAGLVPAAGAKATTEAAATTTSGTAAMYGSRRPAAKAKVAPATGSQSNLAEMGQEESGEESEDESDGEAKTTESVTPTSVSAPESAPTPVKATVIAPIVDDWEAVDDWETNFDKQISLTVAARKEELDANVEDLHELEKRQEHERLKAAGLERQRREEEQRQRREEEERLREEMARKEVEAAMRKDASRRNRLARDEKAKAMRSPNRLRSPISCIMGHVDTGKTKLLDKIRHTNVQEGEAGGITQQIGATQFSRETLAMQTECMQQLGKFDIRFPGLLVIDTPGHESFTNLRSRGSSLCDIAILVIDLMHGLEQQTIESINLLKRRRTPFVVALNKVDRLYGWKTMPDSPIQLALAAQDENVRYEFKSRLTNAITQLMEQGLNAKLYWENDDPSHTVSLVPTSAISGEGVPDLLKMVITLTQDRLEEQLMYMEMLQCTVLEVKVIEGLGHTVDVVLVNGTLREGDTIVVSTMDGPVVTNIRALLTPPPNREMRVKNEFVHHQSLSGSIGVKIVAPDIGRAVAGTPLLVVHPEDDVEDVKEDVQSDLAKVMNSLQTDNRGVTVHASTLGALEALLQFLQKECKPPIPVSQVNIGPIHKKDVMRASIMHEKKLPEFATILAFDVPMDAEAREMAEELNVRVFSAEIIYHLFDQFSKYMNGLREAKKAEAQNVVVFPCVLKILPQYIFNKKDPIVIGVEVLEGTLRLNTPLCVPSSSVDVGRVTRLESNHKEVTSAKKGTQVSIRIVNESNPTITYGRQFDHNMSLYSKITRESIDACKEFFRDEITKDDVALFAKLKKVFNIS